MEAHFSPYFAVVSVRRFRRAWLAEAPQSGASGRMCLFVATIVLLFEFNYTTRH
jgi:hypothetical protein